MELLGYVVRRLADAFFWASIITVAGFMLDKVIRGIIDFLTEDVEKKKPEEQ